MKKISKLNIIFLVLIMGIFVSGCATTLRTSRDYESKIDDIHTIAVFPPDIKVYRLTAGGVKELIDEWSQKAEQYVQNALKKYLGERFDKKIIFLDRDKLEASYHEEWLDNKRLYEAVSQSALLHAFPGEQTFKTKKKNFDYSLGPDIRKLNAVADSDAYLFIYGYDHESTAGRTALNIFNFCVGAFVGVAILPNTPSGMSISLVDSHTGDIQWMSVSPPEGEYSFRSQKHINQLVEWLTKHFIKKRE